MNTSDCISSIQNLIQFFVIVKSLSVVIEQRKSLGIVLEQRKSLSVVIEHRSLLELSLSREVSFLCD